MALINVLVNQLQMWNTMTFYLTHMYIIDDGVGEFCKEAFFFHTGGLWN